jgi:uncharacterized protein YdhG (YjbR/CyaY superfamily)
LRSTNSIKECEDRVVLIETCAVNQPSLKIGDFSNQQRSMEKTIQSYNNSQTPPDKEICDKLRAEIDQHLPNSESKIWHAHPVWFLEGNPIVGYSKLKESVRLMFWSGIDFNEKDLKPGTGKFKDASIKYTSVDQINTTDLKRWLRKSQDIQWDYKNIVKHRGMLERLK